MSNNKRHIFHYYYGMIRHKYGPSKQNIKLLKKLKFWKVCNAGNCQSVIVANKITKKYTKSIIKMVVQHLQSRFLGPGVKSALSPN